MFFGMIIDIFKQIMWKKLSVSQQTLSIILGSILGDGSLKKYKGYLNARLSIRQSIIQKEYFMFKVRSLSEISNPNSVILQQPTGYSKKYLFQSASLPDLTEIYNYTYKNNNLVISRRWLNHLTPLALCIWWLDDGSIISHGKKGVFCTDGFDLLSLQKLARFLQVEYGINSNIMTIKKVYQGQEKTYYRISLSTNELKKFLRIILPYFPVKEMLYKGLIRYKSSELQQRWISEMLELLPKGKFTENDIVQYLK